jgi:CDP-diglyceride synthetase
MLIGTGNEEIVEIPPFDFAGFMREHWLTYLIILVCVIIVYNRVFRPRKLPLLKDAIVYLLMAAGSFLLLIFEVDAGLPIVFCLLVAVALLVVVRVRYWIIDRKKKNGA